MEPKIEPDHSPLDSMKWSLIRKRRTRQRSPGVKALAWSLKGESL